MNYDEGKTTIKINLSWLPATRPTQILIEQYELLDCYRKNHKHTCTMQSAKVCSFVQNLQQIFKTHTCEKQNKTKNKGRKATPKPKAQHT